MHTTSVSHIWSSISASKTLQFPSKKIKTQMDVLKATSWEQESYPIPKDLVFVPILALIFPTLRLFLDRFVFEVNSLPVLSPMLNPFSSTILSYDLVCFFSYDRNSQVLLFCYCYVSTARFSPIIIVQI